MSPAQERLITSRRWWLPQPAAVGSARYIVALALIGATLLLRYALRDWLSPSVPYLQFFPAILIAAWYGGLGPGVVATATASLAIMYFSSPPPGLAVGQPGDLVSLSLFVATGLGVAWTNHQLRTAESERRAEAALATERAERLDAIINTTVDGIIVIDTTGTIEAFNRGAERLFGYPASEVDRSQRRHADAVAGSRRTRRVLLGGLSTLGDRHDHRQRPQVTGRRRDGTAFPLHLSVGEMSSEASTSSPACSTISVSGCDSRSSFARVKHDGARSSTPPPTASSSSTRMAGSRRSIRRPSACSVPESEVIGRNVNILMPSPYHEEHERISLVPGDGRQKIIGTGREVTRPASGRHHVSAALVGRKDHG